MKKSDVFSKFKGIKTDYSKSVAEIKAIMNSSDYSESYKKTKVSEIKNTFYNSYKDKTNQALHMAELCIEDKKVGHKICNVKKMSAEEKIYALNFYTSVIEKMNPKEVMNFMKKDENINNEVYRDCFLSKAEMYKNESDFKSGIFADVDQILTEISGDQIPEVIEYRQLMNDIKNTEGMLNSWHNLKINIEDGDMETGKSIIEDFNMQSEIRDSYTSGGNTLGGNTNTNTGDSQTGGFGFNFKTVRSQEQ